MGAPGHVRARPRRAGGRRSAALPVRCAVCLAVLVPALGGCSSDPGPSRKLPAAPPTSTPAPPTSTTAPTAFRPPTSLDPLPVPTAAPGAGAGRPLTEVAADPAATGRAAAPVPDPPLEGPDDPLAPAPALERAPAPGVPACDAAALTLTDADVVYGPDAVSELFTVRTSGPDCQLPAGYPVARVIGADGTPLAPVARGGLGLPAPGADPLTLSRTTSLSFFVATARDGPCSPAAELVVTLEGAGAELRTATSMQVCAGALGVGPVQRLADDE